MKTKNQIIILILIGILGVAAWQYREYIPFLKEDEAPPAKNRHGGRAVAVIGSAAISRDLPQVITAVGTLRANESVDIASKITAKIRKLAFREGSIVEKGTPLVFLDATEPTAEVAESVAELGNSRKLYERALKLYKTGNAPKARVDLLLSEMQVSEAKVSADKARLSEYVIKAPFTGVVGFREVSAGALVRPGDMITTLDDITLLKLEFNLPELHLARVQRGQTFSAHSVAYKDRSFKGEVLSIASRVDPVSRVVRVRGKLSNKEGLLKPGMFLSVALQTGIEKNAVLIPEHAITVSPAGQFVFVVKDQTVKRTEIEVGQRVKGWVQVLSGVDSGDIVVTEGLQKIQDGRKVKLSIEDHLSNIQQKPVETDQ